MDDRGIWVLVVDEDAAPWKSALEGLYGHAVRIDHVSEETAARAALRGSCHDAALVAERFGPSHGLGLIREATDAGATVPLILVARGCDRAMRQAARRAGAADCVLEGGRNADALERALDAAMRQKRAEAALRESEGRYQALFQALPHASFVYDVETLAIRDVNRAALALYGYSREEFLALTLAEIRPAEDLPRLVEWIATNRECRYAEAGVWRHRKKDGTLFEVEITSNVLGADDCRTRVVVARDVTERRRAEDALRESERRLQAVLDSSKSIFYIKDLDGRFLVANRRLAELLGTSPDAMLGKTDHEFFPKPVADAFRANDLRALEAGRAVEYEETVPHRTGPRAYLSIKAPLRDACGAVQAICGVSTDITYRLRAEEALRLSEERFRGAFDSALIGMSIVSPDGRFVEVNDSLCTFTGYSARELLARNFQSITHPDDLEADLLSARRLLSGEIDSYQMEKRYIHKQGHEVWGLLAVSVVRDAQGNAVYGVGMVEDITPRKRAEEAIARLLDRLRRLRQLDEAILSAPSPREIAGTALDHLLQLLPCCYGRVDLRDTRRGRRIVLAARGVHPGEAAPGTCLRKPLTYKGRALGTLRLKFEAPAVPGPEHREIAREVAGLLAIALRQARLFQQVRRGRRRLSALSERLIAAQEAERRRLARELHDEVGQSLTALKLTIQAGADATDPAVRKGLAEDGAQLIDRLIQQVRNLSLDLRPSMLDDFGLVSALRWYVDGLERRSGIGARCAADPPDLRAPAAIETACFRIAQEALTNVVRHADARNVWVDLRRNGDVLLMTVRDDGAGFDPSTAVERAARGAGLGLLGMRERAALLGGRIEIASSPGRGALVHVAIPLAPTEPFEPC